MSTVQLYHGDCLEILPTLEIENINICLTDPPYGISYDASHKKYKNGIARKSADWDVAPYDPTPLLIFERLIIWGGNCFASRLPDSPYWLTWIKTVRNNTKIRQAEFELAWTRGCIKRPQVFRHLWIGAYRDSESGVKNVHPTQKPIALMRWCLEISKVPKEATVVDPYMGSGTTGVACVKTGRDFIGIEIDQGDFEIAEKRIKEAQLQMRLF